MLGVVKNDWGAILQAVTTDSNSNILATPSLTTLDNQESSFIVGEEIPIKTTTSPGTRRHQPLYHFGSSGSWYQAKSDTAD